MKLGLIAALAVAATAPLLYACHSSSSAAGTPAGIYCHASLAGQTVCYGYSNLTSEEKTAVSDACTTSLQGTISGSCPSGEVGCCSITTAGYDTTECYYVGTASELETGCTAESGKWTASDDGTPGKTTTSPSGGDGGSTATTPPVIGEDSGPTSPGNPGQCGGGQTECPKGCVDESTDVNNCGSCGYTCPAGSSGSSPACVNGMCTFTCPDPSETFCADQNNPSGGHCANLQTSYDDCGQCGNYCPNTNGGEGTCSDGACQVSCPSGDAYCNNECISVTSDDNNCGGCGVTCGTGTVCTSGSCVPGCSGGGNLCGTTCTDLQTDANNCGTCGNVCPYTANSCVNGNCACEVSCVDQYDSPYCCPGGQTCFENGCQ